MRLTGKQIARVARLSEMLYHVTIADGELRSTGRHIGAWITLDDAPSSPMRLPPTGLASMARGGEVTITADGATCDAAGARIVVAPLATSEPMAPPLPYDAVARYGCDRDPHPIRLDVRMLRELLAVADVLGMTEAVVEIPTPSTHPAYTGQRLGPVVITSPQAPGARLVVMPRVAA